MNRTLPILALLATLAISGEAKAGMILQEYGENVANGVAAYTYNLFSGYQFYRGEAIIIEGIDPKATAKSIYPAFFSANLADGTLIFAALRNGLPGTGPVLEIDSRITLPALRYEADRGSPDGLISSVVAVPGASNAVYPAPEPASLAMLGVGLGLAGCWRRVSGRA